jgi:hypothetical protein
LIILGHQTKDCRINAYHSFTKYDGDCRINAYHSFTKYDGINRTPTFLMIDIDQQDFASKDKFDSALNRILKKIKTSIHGHHIVLWTGNGYHIYQFMAGFILKMSFKIKAYNDKTIKC